MEIDLNREECTETSIFINFSIREYVAEMYKKNPEKCWPFGSMGDHYNKVVSSYQLAESTYLSVQNNLGGDIKTSDTTERKAAPKYKIESLRIDMDNGSSGLTSCKVNNSQIQHECNVDEISKIRHNVAADNNEPGRTRPRKKHQKFRLLSDVYKDPASELRAGCERTNPENANKRFVTEVEDDSDDDVTLAAYFRIQKGVEITDSTLQRTNTIELKAQSGDQDRKSNHGSKDLNGKNSNVGVLRKKIKTDDMDTRPTLEHNKEATEKENEDSEMEAVMLLARHFKEEKQILREVKTNTKSVRVKKKVRECSTQSGNKLMTKTLFKTATKHPLKRITIEKIENAACSVQRRSYIRVKATNGGSDVKMNMTLGPYAQNAAAFVCSFNRNPADFSMPDAENKFMRGG